MGLQTETINEQIDIGLMDIKKAEFYKTDGGFTGLKYNDEDYKHVTLKRALPVGQPMEYISVTDEKNKEIGIIKSINDLDKGQFEIVINELNRRYYCPEVLEVVSVKDKLGYVYMELKINVPESGKTHIKNCAIKDVNKNIRMLSNESLIMFDVDGNRYVINKLGDMDKNSLKRLEPFLF